MVRRIDPFWLILSLFSRASLTWPASWLKPEMRKHSQSAVLAPLLVASCLWPWSFVLLSVTLGCGASQAGGAGSSWSAHHPHRHGFSVCDNISVAWSLTPSPIKATRTTHLLFSPAPAYKGENKKPSAQASFKPLIAAYVGHWASGRQGAKMSWACCALPVAPTLWEQCWELVSNKILVGKVECYQGFFSVTCSLNSFLWLS